MALSDNQEPVVEKPVEAQQPKKEEETQKMLNAVQRNLIIMCGPSGAGKSTLIKRLRADYPNGFGFSVSHTTRGPRVGESDGVDYHFTTHEEMEKQIAGNQMLEYAHVHKNVYGTSLAAVQKVIDEQKKCILDIDVQGVESVRKSPMHMRSLYIFLAPPSLQALEDRLRDRGTETEEKIQTRLNNAKKEMEYKDKPNFWDHVIVNDDLDRAYDQFEKALAGGLVKGA